ncbi:hypothetical protein Q9L58_002601 [Maublancomyces gigas]|uniref:Uncharacterized protein n=1 Tax=Discina gigas TaxID=1032678 RepID=A0ABR3GQU0_9PEZI
MKTNASASRADYQRVKIGVDLEDVEACVIHMAEARKTFDSELGVFCDAEHVQKSISMVEGHFSPDRMERLLRYMKEMKFPYYKPSPARPSNSVRPTKFITGAFVLGCAILGLGTYYLRRGRR